MKKRTKKSKKPVLAQKYQQVLRDQVIDEHGAGTIRRDFEIILDFVATETPPVSKKNNLLPMKVLVPLNSRLTHPLNIDVKRPQQKSYPHINALYLLLRASGLGYIEGSGTKLHLALDEAARQSWQNLNPTEQYCTLLETWLLKSSSEIIGEREGRWGVGLWGQPLSKWTTFFQRFTETELIIAGNSNNEQMLSYTPGLYTLALLELFGFVTVKHGTPIPGKGWRILSVKKTPFGEAMQQLFLLHTFGANEMLDTLMMYEEQAESVEFGVLQPMLQEFFPEWQQNVQLAEPEIQEGVYIFKVSLGAVWRRIAIPGDMLLEQLSWAILHAFEFDSDHLYCFICKDRFGRELRVKHSYMDEGPFTDEVQVQEVPLRVGASMTFLFDFGDNWQFSVHLECIDPVDPQLKNPNVLEEKGKAPEQYPTWDEEW